LKKKNNTPLLLRIIRWGYPKLERIYPTLAIHFFTRLFFSPLRYKVPQKERKAETFATEFTIHVAGKKVQCYKWGEGPIVLVVHGWAGRATQFRRFIKPLNAAGYRVIGFDGPAHGNSEGRRTDLREFEEALRKIYQKCGEPVAIIAHSFGGGAVLFSAMNGLRVAKLINISSPTIGKEIIGTYLTTINASEATRAGFEKYIVTTFGKPFDDFTSSYFIRHLPHPIDLMLVHDNDDKEVNIRHAEALLKLYPSAKLFRTSGLGHTRILKDNGVIQRCVTFVQA
jgi:predicted alpha/beta hydrolase family esterase